MCCFPAIGPFAVAPWKKLGFTPSNYYSTKRKLLTFLWLIDGCFSCPIIYFNYNFSSLYVFSAFGFHFKAFVIILAKPTIFYISICFM